MSTKISPDGTECIETSSGYGAGFDDNSEALWVEFDYFLETPKYVQTTLRSRNRVEAVESLMHDTLSTELLGCELDGAFVYNSEDGASDYGPFAAGMPRSIANTKGPHNIGMDLVTGINTSPTDVQIGMCEPRGIVNECRHMRAFVILNLRKAKDNIDESAPMASSEMMDEARKNVKDETKRIIEEACDRGDYNGKFVKGTFIAGVSFVKPAKEVTTLDHGYDKPLAGISSSELESRNRMDKVEAYGIILLAGAAVILAAIAFLVAESCRDARRRDYTKRNHRKKPGKNGGANQDTAAWTEQIIEVETESDEEDVGVMLYLRSPRNSPDLEKEEPSLSNYKSRSGDSSPGVICSAEFYLKYLYNDKPAKRPASPFDRYQKKSRFDNYKKRHEKEDEETQATASISQITRSSSSFEESLDHRNIGPIYEEENEI